MGVLVLRTQDAVAYLSPTIVESILDGRQPVHLTMKDLMQPFPLEWAAQERQFLAHSQ